METQCYGVALIVRSWSCLGISGWQGPAESDAFFWIVLDGKDEFQKRFLIAPTKTII